MADTMDIRDESKGAIQFRRLLLCFQCQRVPVNLIHRACDFKSTWSSTGEIERISPHDGGVPKWLLDFWPTNQRLSDDGTTILGLKDVRLVNDCDIQYFEIQPSDSPDVDEQSEDAYVSQCICVFNHAFPCRNTEVLGEEVISCLLPLAKEFLLPLLASISEGDIRAWLLPRERIQFSINLFDCLQQIFALLGTRSPLLPTSFPQKVLKTLRMTTHRSHRSPSTDACLSTFVEALDILSSASLETFKPFILSATTVFDQRANAWTGLCLGVLLSSQTAKWPRSLSDAIIKTAACWRPISETNSSPMEYLVAIELLPPAELPDVSRLSSFSVEHRILRGLLLSRKQYYKEATEAMEEALPDAITDWGLTSFQVGIAAAESANCYNILRKEDVANTLVTRCLAARNMPELTGRRDWFYLSVCLIDSLIGSGRYTEAKPAIQRVMSQLSIPPSIHMMACLRLSKVYRRAPGVCETAAESHHPLQKGLDLFLQVPITLREEYLEEVSCRLSMGGTTHEMLRLQEALMNAVNDLLDQTDARESPAKKRYTQVQLAFKQQIPRKDNLGQKRYKQVQLDLKHQIPQRENLAKEKLAQERYTQVQPDLKQRIQRQQNHPGVSADKVSQGVARVLSPHVYTIAWICALHIEMAAARAMLDETHPDLPRGPNDKNTYMLGSIGSHNIVLACLPKGQYETKNVASALINMVRTFPSVSKGFIVGIGGGVPSRADIRLGDIVVGVMHYDLGKLVDGNIKRTADAKTSDFSLQTAVSKLRLKYEREPSRVPTILQDMAAKNPEDGHPASSDHPFIANYKQDLGYPKIHHGAIASGNQVMKDRTTRNNVGRELDIICFEMEATGLMDALTCLPIRGICDYSDSHKSKEPQKYAATTAAAYAKELIEILPTGDEISESLHVSNCAYQDALPDRRAQLLESLKFEKIDSRKTSIRKADIKTCRWFLKDPQYLKWLDPQSHANRGFLWIRGKPGAGKSTIMKFIYDQMKKKNRHKHAITASFFFNMRGEDLEKSTPGMYRSLLLQLLEGYPDLQEVLDDTDLVPRGQTGCPSLHVLKDLFNNAVSNLGQRTFTCLIDALDECDEQQVMEMVHYFEELAESCEGTSTHLQICFSSRHYPYIKLRHGIELTLEHQQGHSEDLSNYIQSNLRAPNSVLAEKLRSQMLEKAAGVFLWVVLVVDILNKESRRGGLALQKRLAEVPSGLNDLFKDLLTRDTDNMEDLLLSVLWILCAKRPLRPEEYCHALWAGLVQKDLVDPEMPDIGPDSSGWIESYVITSSKGLAEVSKVKDKGHVVKFIHESVKDFLIKDRGLQDLWPELESDLQSLGHERLKQCCSTYINHEMVHACVRSIDSATKSDGSPGVKERFPFLEYASQHVLYHSDVAAQAIPQTEFLSQTSTLDWVTIINSSEKFKIRRYSPTASLIYILADKGFSGLIRTWLRENPATDIRGERYEYPLFAALVNGHEDAVAALLGLKPSIWEGVDLPKGFGSKTGFTGYKGRTPLTWAAQEGQMKVLKALLRKGIEIDESDQQDYTSLIRASEAGHHAIVSFLIKEGAKVESRHSRRAMSLSLGNGHVEIVKLLIEANADLGSDPCLQNALTTASSQGFGPLTEYFLDQKADVRDPECYTALCMASKNGHLAIVKLLLERGVPLELDATDWSPQSALTEASRNGHEAIVRLLVQQGARLEAPGAEGRTALTEASRNGHEAIVRFLVQQGANIESRDSNGLTPLHLAASGYFPCDSIIKVLIDNGADIQARDNEGSTPLHLAAANEHVLPGSVIGVLINNGADIQARDNQGSTPLHLALNKPRDPDLVVRTLVQNGADVDSPNHRGDTPRGLVQKRGLPADHPLALAIEGSCAGVLDCLP